MMCVFMCLRQIVIETRYTCWPPLDVDCSIPIRADRHRGRNKYFSTIALVIEIQY